MTEKYYQLGTHTAEQFHEIHDLLCKATDGVANIPNRACVCNDDKVHSPTRGTFTLTEDEANSLKSDSRIKFINVDFGMYPETYKPPPEELQSSSPDLLNRWQGNVKIIREHEDGGVLPGTPDSTDLNRGPWGLIRHNAKLDPYIDESRADNYVYTTTVQQYGDGADVDLIVADDGGGWIGHPEFQNNCAGDAPDGYTGGNVLPGNGTCDVLDLYLDGPYYLDPDYFDNTDPEYNNGAVGNVVGNGSDFFKREVTTNGVRIMGAGTVGGQTAVPDAWLEKVARMYELFLDPNGTGINESFQRAMIQTLSGDAGTYHAGKPTIQRVARGAGSDYSPNFLTDQGVVDWNLTNLYDTHVQNDMVWYLNSTGDGYGDGDIDAQEVIEHVFHTLHMHGLPADDIKLYQFLAADWQSGDLYAAMEEAYDAGKWDPSGYQENPDDWKTDGDAFEVAAKEYLYLLNFCMFEYTDLWDGGSLAPEWTDDMRTQAGILANNPLGYAFHNTYIAPVISKPSLATIRSIFQDGNTPDQDDPTLAGASGYVVDVSDRLTTRWDGTTVPVESFARNWWKSTDNRSAVFNAKHPNAGTLPLQNRDTYTRAYCNGSNTAQSSVGTHCTPCMALSYGRTQGWAYNANKWVINNYGTNGADIDMCFDLQKIFHNTKPVNSKYGTQDPTISSNSWGYRAGKGDSGDYYHFRTDTPVQYGGRGDPTEPNFISNMGTQGDTFFGTPRWKSEMKTNIYTTALDEAIDAGVIFVMAAGNSNQKQTEWDHQDFNNYISDISTRTLEDSSYEEFNLEVTGTTNRRGFPQQGGKEEINQSTYTFNATAPAGTAYYRIVGTDRTGAIDYNNGPITVRKGDTIELTNDADSSHTMFIKTVNSSGPSDQVTGATGQGAYGGSTITWTPTSVGTYYYKCLNHVSMGGEIRVTSAETIYKTINIGALDDEYDTSSGNRERKVGYSDRGNAIDAYFAADGILAANRSYTSTGRYPDTYPGFTANSGSGSGVPEDCAFGGTSAACPVGAGFIATLVGLNRNWTYNDVKTYFANLDNQDSSVFYPGTESTSADDANWNDYTSLEGGDAKVAYQDISQLTQTTPPKRAATLGNGLSFGNGLSVTRVNRFDRGR